MCVFENVLLCMCMCVHVFEPVRLTATHIVAQCSNMKYRSYCFIAERYRSVRNVAVPCLQLAEETESMAGRKFRRSCSERH
jgi:hypothetical protein